MNKFKLVYVTRPETVVVIAAQTPKQARMIAAQTIGGNRICWSTIGVVS